MEAMMNNQTLKYFIIILSAIFLLSSPALAGGKGRGKNKTQPPGWEQGEKTGWEGEDTPPGLNKEKLEKKQKGRMKREETRTRSRKEVQKAKQETDLEAEKVEQEAEMQKEKKKQEAEMKKEKEQMRSTSKKKKG
jgi:hypothetical protein